MNANIFDLPDALVAHRVQATAYGQNSLTANQLLTTAVPSAPPPNETIPAATLSLIMGAIDLHFKTAQSMASIWETGDPVAGGAPVKDDVLTALESFSRFSARMAIEYPALVAAAYEGDNPAVTTSLINLKRIIEILIAENKGAKASVASYQAGLSKALAAFSTDFDRVLTEVGTVSSAITGLQNSIASLQADIAANNAAVLDTFLSTAATEVRQGATIAQAGAKAGVGEDPSAALEGISAGVEMGIAFGEGLEAIIKLNEKTLQDLLQIRKLGLEVGEDELVLTTLINIGSLLTSLGATTGLELDIVGDIVNYFGQLDNDIAAILRDHGDDPSAQIDTTNYTPGTVSLHNPSFPPWNVLDPLARTSKVFNLVIDLEPTVFADKTVFAAL